MDRFGEKAMELADRVLGCHCEMPPRHSAAGLQMRQCKGPPLAARRVRALVHPTRGGSDGSDLYVPCAPPEASCNFFFVPRRPRDTISASSSLQRSLKHAGNSTQCRLRLREKGPCTEFILLGTVAGAEDSSTELVFGSVPGRELVQIKSSEC
jgi:hypothetical protein